MQIGLNKRTALAITRAIRSSGLDICTFTRRSNVPSPDPSPFKNMTMNRIDLSRYGLGSGKNLQCTIDFAVPSAHERIRTKNATCTVYGNGCPADSFVNLGGGLAISCPELLFLEMARFMNPAERLLLGYELCGRYSRDAIDPLNGKTTYDINPATDVERIRDFANRMKYARELHGALHTLELLEDNCWSPMEAIIATLMRLPIDSLGYEMGKLDLNPRADPSDRLRGATTREYRRPDIVISGSGVGINYDGGNHADLRSIADSAIQVGTSPGERFPQIVLDRTLGNVREKLADDVHRNRELAAFGYTVFPTLKEDLYARGGLDRLMLLVCEAVERKTGRDMGKQREAIANPSLSAMRYELILSLLPGKHERNSRM